jgi:SAM-dependent methyltransferase
MQDRHVNRKQYFAEQIITTEKHVLPYIMSGSTITADAKVLEIGCGEGGNLVPFLNRGYRVWGIDLASTKIENAKKFIATHPQKNNATFDSVDFLILDINSLDKFDIIMMRDVVEHITDIDALLAKTKTMLKPGGLVFIAFGPWRMPFGGHQQICASSFLSKLPYIHLLPRFLFVALLKAFNESSEKINTLLAVRATRLSSAAFKKYASRAGFSFLKQDYYLLNPNYEVKFNLKPRKLPFLFNIPWLRDFFTTSYYCLLQS